MFLISIKRHKGEHDEVSVLLISILAVCSSPPEPPTPVQFEKANEVINPHCHIPDFHGVIKSDVSGKGWVYEITSLSGVQARTPTFITPLMRTGL